MTRPITAVSSLNFMIWLELCLAKQLCIGEQVWAKHRALRGVGGQYDGARHIASYPARVCPAGEEASLSTVVE